MNAAAAFLEGLGRVSAQGAVLVLLVLLAQRLLARQLAPRWRCALWLVVMARLVLPVSVSSVASIFNMMPSLESTRSVIPSSFKRVDTALDESSLIEVNRIEPRNDPDPMPDFQTPPKFAEKPSAPRVIPWPALLVALWLAGVLALAAYIAVGSRRMARRFSALSSITDPGLLSLAEECLQAHGVGKRLSVAESPDVTTPALYGFFRPVLLLPPGFAARFSASEARFILLHEAAHVKRRDIAFNWLATVLQVVHWFNPLIWLGFGRWRADRELACDAMALDAAGPEQNRAYGQTILRLLEGFAPRAAVPGLVGILEDKRQLRRRISMIADYVPRRKWQILALLLVAALAITGLTDAQDKSSRPEKPKEAKTEKPARPVVTNGPAMKVTVVDAQTGQPVPDAEVVGPDFTGFFGGRKDRPRWTTDKGGLAVIHLGEAPAGHLQQVSWFPVSVRHAGYAPRAFMWSAHNKDVRPSMPGELTVRLQRGLTIGGMVCDEQGSPIAGVNVQVEGNSSWGGAQDEYSDFWSDPPDSPAAVTDAQGRWEVRDFPRDLEYVVITLSWPNGSDEKFTASPPDDSANNFRFQHPGDPFNVADLRDGKLKLTLKTGVTVQGIVVDPKGRPFAGVPVKAGFGVFIPTQLQATQTDEAARFQFLHCLHPQLIVTACPGDYAVTSMIIDVKSNNAPARLQVAPLQPLRMRVEDGKGVPLRDAAVAVDWFGTEGQILDFAARTDRNGVAVWTNAPLSAFDLRATSPDGGVAQKVRVTPGQRDITFKLRSGMNQELIVTARAHDATTGAPVQLESLRYKTGNPGAGYGGESASVDSALRLAISAERFTPGGQFPEFKFEAKAKGYSTYYSDWRAFDEGDWSPDFAFVPDHGGKQVALLPDGSAAAGARVVSQFEQGRDLVWMNEPGKLIGGNWNTQTRADGSFQLPVEPDDEAVLFMHAGGILQTTAGEIEIHPTVRLQPYGRVLGNLNIAGHARQGVSVSISSIYLDQAPGLHVNYTTTTAADGRFEFSSIPAGDYVPYRPRPDRGGPITEDHPMPITVGVGETRSVDYRNEGRQIVGHAVPDRANLDVDWLNDDHTLTVVQSPERYVSLEDYATRKGGMAAWARTGHLAGGSLGRGTYRLEFNPDGSFHAEDIPAGRYSLQIQVTKPGADLFRGPYRNADDDLGKLEREIVVPPGNGPLDLGNLTVNFK